MDYKENDNELIFLINEGNEEASSIIVDKYKSIIETVLNTRFPYNNITGLERNDLYQEGMIGLLNAINSYKDNKDAKFSTYAYKCIENKINNAIIRSLNQKNKNLNESLSLDSIIDEESKLNLYEVIGVNNTEDELINKETLNEIINFAHNNLKGLALRVFDLKIKDYSNEEIASILNTNKRNIENALFRIRKKMAEYKAKN